LAAQAVFRVAGCRVGQELAKLIKDCIGTDIRRFVLSDREMCMEKGELLGKGMTAEVYKWGQDKVLKLYIDNYNEEWVKREVVIGQKIHEAGVPSPMVFDMVEIDGRKGVIFQRIFGKTILSIVETEPWMLCSFVKQMAGFHYKIHKCSTDGIPSQKEKFALAIKLSSEILGDKVKKILNYVDRLPEGDNICHGDLYFSNIIVSNNKLVAIDWSSGYIGDPSGDLARTCLIINSPAISLGTPDIVAAMYTYTNRLVYWTYLNEYMRVAKIKSVNIDAWMLPVAAARLKDKIPGEEKWLRKIINKRLDSFET
jgi:uncharacterized protein (TIGR02172 family)